MLLSFVDGLFCTRSQRVPVKLVTWQVSGIIAQQRQNMVIFFYKYADFFLRCFWSVFCVWFTAVALASEMMTQELVSELDSLDDKAVKIGL